MIAVVAIAYGSQAPSLGVAEFAPAARQAVDAPPTTVGDATGRSSSGGRGRSTTTTTPVATASTAPDSASASTTPTTKVGRARPCYGDPPRQTEDPMSPVCMPYVFEGDNGGATSIGVTATEIRIGIPAQGPSATSSFNRAVDAFMDAFNRDFEFYGRRLVPVYVGGGTRTAAEARATAANTAAQNVFGATTAMVEWLDGQQAAASELARQGVVTVTRNSSTWWTDRTLYDAMHPYVWSTNPSSEDIQANLASLGCQSLAGHNASSSIDADLKAKPRKFGIVAVGHESTPNVSVLMNGLEACTGEHPSVLGATTPTWGTVGRPGFEKFRTAGVTTVFCVCEGYQSSSAYSQAHAAGYHPEWIMIGGYSGSGTDEDWVSYPRNNGQLSPPIRVGPGPRLLPIQARPWYPAIAPLVSATNSLTSFIAPGEVFYTPLLVLAAGIQAAGPQLTPETFAAGLMSLQFPNPGAGAPPYWQPSAGFGPGDHSFFDDYNVGWWSDTADALDTVGTAKGSWCYLSQAARFRPGTYPTNGSELLFNPNVPCR